MSFSAFQDATAAAIIAHCDWMQEERGAEFADALVRSFVYKDRAAVLPQKPGPEQAFVDTVAFGFRDVVSPYKALSAALMFVERPPPAGVERTQYLQYHMEHWLHSLYVLKERTRRYITSVSRLYRGTRSQAALAQCARRGEELFRCSFPTLLEARGHHVHVASLVPPMLSELYVFDSLAEVYRRTYSHPAVPNYADLVSEWSTLLCGTNSEVTEVLDEIFSSVHPTVFDGQQPLLPPYPSTP